MIFNVGGQQMKFRGTISIVSADNPASALLGGFKQSGSAFRPCRHCMGVDVDIQTKVVMHVRVNGYMYMQITLFSVFGVSFYTSYSF